MPDVSDALLHDIGLLDQQETIAFDTLTRLAGEMIGAPVTLVSIVMPDEDRQYFKSAAGLAEPWLSRRQTPLSHSFCKHVRASDKPLIVQDARQVPLVAQNGAVADLGVIAYAGFPLHGPAGNAIGAFCAIDGTPRDWTEDHLRVIAEFAAITDDQIRLLAALRERNIALASEREAMAARTRLLTTISHEVRTPLAGILGMADLLLDQVQDTAAREMVVTIRNAGRALLRLQNDFLDMAKAEAGKMRLEQEAFDLTELLGELHRLHGSAAHAKVTVSLRCAPDLPKVVIGDQYRLQQILHNLMSNAIKFTDRGEVALSAAPDPETPGAVVFSVRDTGIGMTPEQVSRLFVPFEQAETQTARRYGGTGLGTSIADRLITLMQGTIHVESVFGQGSCFSVSLPLPQAAAPAAEPAGTPQHGSPASFVGALQGKLLLVGDDNATNRKILEAFLTKAGAKVVMVCDGIEAVDRARGGNFDAVLLDISMPVLDGMDALAQITSTRAQAGALPMPAVAVTANATDEDREHYLEAGFNAVVSKPFSLLSLTAAVEGVLRRPPAPH